MLATEGGERKRKRSRKTRNNVQIVLRSVLRFAKDKGHISATPAGLPRLKRDEQTILEIPLDEEVHIILRTAAETQRRGFALIAYAGLRPNEVRARRYIAATSLATLLRRTYAVDVLACVRSVRAIAPALRDH